MHRIAIAGHVCVDIRPRLGPAARLEPGRLIEVGPVSITLGGAVGNTSRSLRALGADVRAFTAVGDDELGEIVRIELAGMPGPSVVDRIAGWSTSYSVILEPAGVDRTIWHHVGANAAFDGRGIDLGGIDLFHLGYPPLLPALLPAGGAPLRELLSGARASGVTTSVDLAVVDPASPSGGLDWNAIIAAMAPECDVLSPSLDDLTSIWGAEVYSPGVVARLADRLLGLGTAVVAISAGEHGLFIATADAKRLRRAGRALSAHADEWAHQRIHVPPFWAESPVTTNGAGDASTAGLLHGIASGAGPADSARLAAACSAAVVSGQTSTPDTVLRISPDLAAPFPRLAARAADPRN